MPNISAITYQPTIQRFTSGSGTYGLSRYFTVINGNATAGAVYTNNGFNFTVVDTISSGSLLLCTSSGAPTASGVLTKSSGTGDTTINFIRVKKPSSINVSMVGGGGGGSQDGNNATAGGDTTFGSSLLTANGAAVGGGGGSTTINAPAIGFGVTGGSGGLLNTTFGITQGQWNGGMGAASAFGGAGGSGGATSGSRSAGRAAQANTGSGGGGASTPGNNGTGGNGGGAGGYICATINNPSDTYVYAVGTAGAASGAGGAGAAGIIIVEEIF